MKVEIWSDVACPWCWIGTTRFERALDAFAGRGDVEVAYRPYQLDPHAPPRAEPMLDYLTRRFGAGARAMTGRVVEQARSEGLAMDYEHGLAVNTFDAHRLLRLAGAEPDAGTQRRVSRRLFAAHFAEGRDVGDREVLAAVAAEAGMDAERVRRSLASDEGAREVRDEIAHARRIGVTAVPTFVFDDRWAVQGAQPTAAFAEALATVAAAAADPEASGAR